MLQTVGNPVAVSPDIALMRAASGALVGRRVEDQADDAAVEVTHLNPVGGSRGSSPLRRQ